MPERGEIRRGATETVQWDGTRWNPIDSAPATGEAARYHPNMGDDYTSAFLNEIGRTGKEAAIGLARSPLDFAKNAVNTVLHPIDTISGIARTVAHPIDTVSALAENPREAGSVLGQLLLGKVTPDALSAVADRTPAIGRGVQSVGRGMEAAGDAVLNRSTPLGMTAAGTAFSGHPLAAAAEVGLPLVAKYGGRGVQALGRTIEGLQRAVTETPEVPKPNSVLSGVTLSPEAVARNIEATNLRDVQGYSPTMAAKLAGIPGAGKVKVTNVPMGEWTITDAMIRNRGGVPSASMQGLQDAVGNGLPSSFQGLPTDEDVQAEISARNATGRWR